MTEDDDPSLYDLNDPAAAAALAQWLAGVRVVRAAWDGSPDPRMDLIAATIDHEAAELLRGDEVERLRGLCSGTAAVAKCLLHLLLEGASVDADYVLNLVADTARKRYGLPPQNDSGPEA